MERSYIEISIKVAVVIVTMNKLKYIFPHQILRTLYNSLIHPFHLWIIYLGIFPKTVNNTTKESCKNISPNTIHITYYLYLQRLENSEVKRPVSFAALQAVPQDY